jgi:hypothetical protein
MTQKIVYQTDHLGLYVGETEADESPLEPGEFLIPGGCVEDPPTDAGLCDDFRPRYAVDLQVLAHDGEPDPHLPPLLGVALPVMGGGDASAPSS